MKLNILKAYQVPVIQNNKMRNISTRLLYQTMYNIHCEAVINIFLNIKTLFGI